MRVFHFVNQRFGLDDLRKRRLKVATLNELNDPFEFLGVSLANEALRHAFQVAKRNFATKNGLLCFSRTWHNPVMWSHYSEKHTGLCLGFDIPDGLFEPVTYSRKRQVVEVETFLQPNQLTPEALRRYFFTKYSHWRYEDEVRGVVPLKEKDPKKKMYFADFCDNLRLAMVIVGVESNVTRDNLRTALGDQARAVEIFKARLAFRSFRVVPQRKPELWA